MNGCGQPRSGRLQEPNKSSRVSMGSWREGHFRVKVMENHSQCRITQL